MTLLDEIKRLKNELAKQEKHIEDLNKRITELITQLSDAQFGSRVKDRIIAEQEVIIREYKKEL